jgi:glutathione reductase (NADPH)
MASVVLSCTLLIVICSGWCNAYSLRHLSRLHVVPLHASRYDYDYLVVGGGSGGVASARRAAGYGARVALVEKSRLGGTCVNAGCVPKKIMYNAASVAETMRHSAEFGFKVDVAAFSWSDLKNRMQAYIARLNSVYDRMLANSNVTVIEGEASFVDSSTVHVGDRTVTAANILIAVGGKPWLPSPNELHGVQHCISSDDIFQLQKLPRRVAVIGGGYIGVELAGVLKALGADTHIFTLWKNLLSDRFDSTIVETLQQEMQRQGIVHHAECSVAEVRKSADDGPLTLVMKDGSRHGTFEQVKTAASLHNVVRYLKCFNLLRILLRSSWRQAGCQTPGL